MSGRTSQNQTGADAERLPRKLASIIAVDVVGYTRLVESAEEQAIAAVSAGRAVIGTVIADCGGRIFNHAGDGVMAETPSAAEAVRAAFGIHEKLRQFNDDHPDWPDLQVRIGVNLGDVVTKPDGDLVGHGVNIASRLESVATPGETVISQNVYDQLRGDVAHGFHPSGHERLKNITAPIAVFRTHDRPVDGPIGWAGQVTRFAQARRTWLAYGATLALAVLGVTALALNRGERPAPDTPARALAVLPFLNLSDDPANDYFSDGVTEEVLSALFRLEEIKVIGRTSSFRFRDAEAPIAEMRQSLNVSHVLEGSVRRDEGRVRVSVQLIDADDESRLWAESYDRQAQSLLDVQENIAQSVATALRARLSSNVAQSQLIDPETYEIYLRGRHLFHRRGDSLRQSIMLFERAVERNAEFADAWSSLASALSVLPGYETVPFAQVADRAKAAADRALAINPQSAEALAVLAVHHRRKGEWAEAEAAFQRVLALEPNNLTAVYWYGEFLLSVGRFADALSYFEQAYAIDPLSPYTSVGMGWGQYFRGDLEGAEKAFERAWDVFGLKTRHVWEGLYSVQLDQGDYGAARALLAQIPGAPQSQAALAGFVTALENPADMTPQIVAASFAAADPKGALPYYWQYEAYSRLGMTQHALVAAQGAKTAYGVEDTQPLFTPSAKSTRADPAFADIIEGLGLVDYWRQAGWPDFCADPDLPYRCEGPTL